eukprot:3163771-Ditylum_brightwellii.AAC.1
MSANGKCVSKRVAKGYVDNTDSATADQRTQEADTPAIIATRITAIAQTWADLIFGSCGNVSLPKSCWWLMWWNWKNGKARIATIAEVEAQIKLRSDVDTEMHTLSRKEPTDSIQQLGLLNNPVGILVENYNKRYSTYKKWHT